MGKSRPKGGENNLPNITSYGLSPKNTLCQTLKSDIPRVEVPSGGGCPLIGPFIRKITFHRFRGRNGGWKPINPWYIPSPCSMCLFLLYQSDFQLSVLDLSWLLSVSSLLFDHKTRSNCAICIFTKIAPDFQHQFGLYSNNYLLLHLKWSASKMPRGWNS